MIRSFVAGLTCLLVLSGLSLGAEAAPESARKKRATSRTIEIRYEDGAIPYAACLNCPATWALPGERFMSVEVIDDVSPTGNVDVAWSTNGSDDPGYFNVCGQTDKPQRIRPSVPLTLYPWLIPGEDCPTGFSTSGTIKITFSRRP